MNKIDSETYKIWSKLFSKNNEDLSQQEQIELIKPIIQDVYDQGVASGKRKILNHFEIEIGIVKQQIKV